MDKSKILVVDDERFNINIVVDLLSSEHQILAAKSGQQALKFLQSGTLPDLILLDIMMPEIDGYEVCRRLQNDPATRDIPVIFLTAKNDEDSIEKAYEVGGVDYITKPFKPKELLSRVKRELTLKNLITSLETSNDQLASLAKENLDYASLMQQSLVPDDKSLLDCFGDFFIIQSKKDVVTSKNYLFIEINDNEFAYVMIDSKIDNIKSAFFTMILNGIEKEIVSSINHKDHLKVDSLWVFNYFNSAITSKTGQEKCPMSVVYYNKLDNTLKYTANNGSLWYTDNDSYYSVHCSDEVIEETSIEIQEELKFYLDLDNVIKDKISDKAIESNFQLPLAKQRKTFEELLNDTQDDVLFGAFIIDNKAITILEYDGLFKQSILGDFTDTIEDCVDNIGVISNLLTILSEQFQNVMNYAKSSDVTNEEVVSKGIIKVQDTKSQYVITTTNIISLEDRKKVEPKLEEISQLDRQGIRKRYKELRKSGENTHSKGGGVGFYEIAKRCHNSNYKFEKINDERYFFTYKSILIKSKK
ncbi:MAG: response regulator [Gammaproteobacteria bacterium]|nr:response regulator [Gammaproteobacteria bacterium]